MSDRLEYMLGWTCMQQADLVDAACWDGHACKRQIWGVCMLGIPLGQGHQGQKVKLVWFLCHFP